MWKLFCIGALLVPGAFAASLQQVRTIYILSMGGSLDQYLAQHIARDGRYEIVTDPQRADAVLTDRVGESFERKLDEIYPPPKDESKDDDKDDNAAQNRVGGFSRARGNVFLVDRASRVVLWSNYVPVHSTSREETEKRAKDIVSRLRKDTDKLRKNASAPVAAPVASPAPSGVQ